MWTHFYDVNKLSLLKELPITNLAKDQMPRKKTIYEIYSLRFWTSCQGLCQFCFRRGGRRRRAKVGRKGGISARIGGLPDAHGTVPSPLGNADDPDAVGVVSPVAMVAEHHLVLLETKELSCHRKVARKLHHQITISTIKIITYFVVRLGALEASLALHALPVVGLDHWNHLPGESKAPRVV